MADLAAHATAAVAQSAEGLEEVSSRFEQTGALLLAADAATGAASAYERRGERRAAAAARLRAATFARECGLAQGSALDVLPPPALTAREQEVARLASAGLSNQAIADRLVVSVRTVETHLSHAYAKLGISSRADLRTMLPTAALARSGPSWTPWQCAPHPPPRAIGSGDTRWSDRGPTGTSPPVTPCRPGVSAGSGGAPSSG
jgi:DNA-binding CsgD family transcriptional regulator